MADKSVTIKSATDRQLDELIVRLRKENEAQNLIFDIKRKSKKRDPLNNYDYSYEFPDVSTEKPIEDLYHDSIEETLAHFGVLGMKWGVRKADKYKTKMLNKSKKKADLANKANKEAKTVLDDLNKRGKKSRHFSEFDYESLRDAKVDYSLSVKRSAIVGKTWLSVNETLKKTDVNTISKKEMTKMVKDIIEKGKKEAHGWVYY